MKNLLVSACLLGIRCRYDGRSCPNAALRELNEHFTLIPVCPEVLGSLPTPRVPSERKGDAVTAKDGRDVSAEYQKGAALALELARAAGCDTALLKERSPSCGCGWIYDGTFSGTLTPGNGVCAELLQKNGIRVYGESHIDELLSKDK